MPEEILITPPIILPGNFIYAKNYRSTLKPRVLVVVKSVKTGWDEAGKYRHAYDCIRVNSKAVEIGKYSNGYDYYRGKRGCVVRLYVNEHQLFKLP